MQEAYCGVFAAKQLRTMSLPNTRFTSGPVAVRWAVIGLALLAGLGEWLALLRARRRQQLAHH